MPATTLSEQSAQYAAETTSGESLGMLLRRAWMAGAVAALTSSAPREQLLRECLEFGRAIGTSAERAST